MIISFLPLAILTTLLLATLLRLIAVKRGSGITAWVGASASGAGRTAGLFFAASLGFLGVSAAVSARTGAISLTGSALAVIGAAIAITAQIQMGRAWRIGVRPGDAPLLIEHGLYHYSRNPIYAGMILTGLGIALASGSPTAWGALTVFILSSHVQIRIEEAHMQSNFGAAFTVFCKRVPRWI